MKKLILFILIMAVLCLMGCSNETQGNKVEGSVESPKGEQQEVAPQKSLPKPDNALDEIKKAIIDKDIKTLSEYLSKNFIDGYKESDVEQYEEAKEKMEDCKAQEQKMIEYIGIDCEEMYSDFDKYILYKRSGDILFKFDMLDPEEEYNLEIDKYEHINENAVKTKITSSLEGEELKKLDLCLEGANGKWKIFSLGNDGCIFLRNSPIKQTNMEKSLNFKECFSLVKVLLINNENLNTKLMYDYFFCMGKIVSNREDPLQTHERFQVFSSVNPNDKVNFMATLVKYLFEEEIDAEEDMDNINNHLVNACEIMKDSYGDKYLCGFGAAISSDNLDSCLALYQTDLYDSKNVKVDSVIEGAGCYFGFAVMKNDRNYCDMIEKYGDKNSGLKYFTNEVLEECESYFEEYDFEYNNELKVGTAEFNLKKAIQDENPQICLENEYKDIPMCIHIYSLFTNDISSCDLILEAEAPTSDSIWPKQFQKIRNFCRSNYAFDIHDSSFCEDDDCIDRIDHVRILSELDMIY